MKYPSELSPVASEKIHPLDGSSIDVPKSLPTFSLWLGTVPGPSYGGKAILTHKEQPAFAELIIVRSFIDAGWEGVWIDTFGRRYLRNFWPEPSSVQIPPEREQLVAELSKRGNARPWDVFCWRGEDLIFVEAKRAKKDQIRASQIAFLQNAIAAGLPTSSFLIVEWRLANSA